MPCFRGRCYAGADALKWPHEAAVHHRQSAPDCAMRAIDVGILVAHDHGVGFHTVEDEVVEETHGFIVDQFGQLRAEVHDQCFDILYESAEPTVERAPRRSGRPGA